LNATEALSIFTSTIIVFVGLVYSTDQLHYVSSILLFVVVILFIFGLIVFWLGGVLRALVNKYIEHKMKQLEIEISRNSSLTKQGTNPMNSGSSNIRVVPLEEQAD
jgi:hypothetical protein